MLQLRIEAVPRYKLAVDEQVDVLPNTPRLVANAIVQRRI